MYLEPTPVRDLVGEEVVQVAMGASHALGISCGGDCYVWGQGNCGQLGLGEYKPQQTPVLLAGL
ncbi:unnamed protein product, partial [Discosporangium mesarthrocarpum]